MPLTPNGKIDKSKLPFPDTAIMLLNRTKQEVKEQLTQLQAELMNIWEETLGELDLTDSRSLRGRDPPSPSLTRRAGRPVHPDDNFFEVGGHSIMATRLTFQLRDQLKQVCLALSHLLSSNRTHLRTGHAVEPAVPVSNCAPASQGSRGWLG